MLKILKPMLVILILGLSLKPALAQDPGEYQGETGHRIIHTPNPGLDIELWSDKGDGSTYYPGEDIRVYFRASRDCYVVVYNLDTKGYVNILYPYNSSDERYVEGGRVYKIPGRNDDYSLTVDGPSGTEYIQAVASYEPLSVPGWSDYYREGAAPEDIRTLRMDENEDPYVFMEWVDHQLSPDSDFVTNVTDFNVRYPHPSWYYHPDLYQYYPYSYPYDLGSAYIWAPFAADVYIDGIFFGIAPLTIPSIVCGRHFVTVYYNGCRLWDNYFNVESRRTVRIQTRLDQRVRYVTEDPVKKEYRTWKDKEYRLVQERRSETPEQKIRNRSDFAPNRNNITRREEKSTRTGGPVERNKEGYRTDYQNRNGMKNRGRDFVPEKHRTQEMEFRTDRFSQGRGYSQPRSAPRGGEMRTQRNNGTAGGREEVRTNRGERKR